MSFFEHALKKIGVFTASFPHAKKRWFCAPEMTKNDFFQKNDQKILKILVRNMQNRPKNRKKWKIPILKREKKYLLLKKVLIFKKLNKNGIFVGFWCASKFNYRASFPHWFFGAGISKKVIFAFGAVFLNYLEND